MTVGPAESTLAPLQQAFYTRMVGDSTLSALASVFDHVPESFQGDYIELGESVETPNNALRTFGSDTVATLHIWTRARGYARGLAIANRLRELFDHQPLTIPGQHVVSVRHEQTLTMRDPDPEVRHIPVYFRVTTEQE